MNPDPRESVKNLLEIASGHKMELNREGRVIVVRKYRKVEKNEWA